MKLNAKLNIVETNLEARKSISDKDLVFALKLFDVSTLIDAVPSSLALLPSPILLEDVVISRELLARRVRIVNTRAEITGMHAVANLMTRGPYIVLKRLAQLAIELCDAGTGGISMIEAGNDGQELFRWQALAGELEKYEGGTTPREWSPCGECLKRRTPMLYFFPARYFTYFQSVDTTIVDCLVIPMCTDGTPVGTIWIVSHNEGRHFDAEDVRVMTSLGSFVTAALQGVLRDHPDLSTKPEQWGERLYGENSFAV